MPDRKENGDEKSVRERVRTAFAEAAGLAGQGGARRERPIEDILYGDVPTFMELPLADGPEALAGADAVVLGFGYEGITIKTPSLSAPPTVSRPLPGSIYWRMGADLAPAAIRKASIFYSVHHNRGHFPEIDPESVLMDELKLFDYGDIDVLPGNTRETIRRASAKVSDIVAADALPILLGGDHTTSYPALRAIAEKAKGRIGVISFDAHMDLSDTPEYWASTEWVKSFETGRVDPRNFVEIGIRSNRSTLFERAVAKSLGIRAMTIDEVKASGIEAAVREAIRIAGRGTDAIYVSLDIDVMEPALVPAQKAPEIWGLTIDEIMLSLRLLSRERLAGFDVCEMTPDYDVNAMGAQFCARTVVEILGGLAVRKREAQRR